MHQNNLLKNSFVTNTKKHASIHYFKSWLCMLACFFGKV